MRGSHFVGELNTTANRMAGVAGMTCPCNQMLDPERKLAIAGNPASYYFSPALTTTNIVTDDGVWASIAEGREMLVNKTAADLGAEVDAILSMVIPRGYQALQCDVETRALYQTVVLATYNQLVQGGCWVSEDNIPEKSYPLFRAWGIMEQLVTDLQQGQKR